MKFYKVDFILIGSKSLNDIFAVKLQEMFQYLLLICT